MSKNDSRQDYCDDSEPPIEELLADPILHLVLRRDRLELADTWLAIVDARQRLASGAGGYAGDVNRAA